MADTQSIRQSVESRAPFSTWLGVVLLFSLFGAIVFAVVGPAPRGDSYEQLRAQKRLEKLKTLHEGEAKQLTTYSWVDKNKGVVGLPIDRAMTLTVAELAAKKPAAAYPIATPAPQVSATPATPTGPATASPAPTVSPTPTGIPKPTSVAGPSSASRGQPAAAVVPPPAPPGTQPGAPASPAASPAPGTAKPKPAPSPEKTP
jgi:hypothetical protein